MKPFILRTYCSCKEIRPIMILENFCMPMDGGCNHLSYASIEHVVCGNLPPVRQALGLCAGCHAAGVGPARCCLASTNN